MLFPVDGSLRLSRVIQLGGPIRADALLARAGGDRRLVMDAIGLAVAELLPPPYRGVYGNAEDFPDASQMLRDSRVTA